MTRLLAFGDLHLDAGTQHRADALADHEATLDRIHELVVEHDVDLVLFAGDAFHRPHASDRARHVLHRFLARLAGDGVPFVGVLGNASHDIYGTDRETALELEHNPPAAYVSRYPEVIQVAGLSVCTLPSTQVTRLVAAANGGDRSAIYLQAAERLVDTARGLHACAERPAILLGHWSVTGASLPNGLPVDDLNEVVLPLDALDRLGFDAIVLGHIHNPVMLPTRGTPGFYTGSPMTLDFGEAHVPHGVWILDTDLLPDAGLAFEWVPLPQRRFVTVDVDLMAAEAFALAQTGEFDETDAIAGELDVAALDGAIVRVRYTASEGQHLRVDQGALRRLIADAGGRCYSIAPNIVREARRRAAEVDETLGPLEALRAWCGSASVIPGRWELLEAITRELLDEVAA